MADAPVLFEGAEYRGRGRETFWRGKARLLGNAFKRVQAINHFNADKLPMLAADGASIDFDTVTTGNFSGFDLYLEDRNAGAIDIASNMIRRRFDICHDRFRGHHCRSGRAQSHSVQAAQLIKIVL